MMKKALVSIVCMGVCMGMFPSCEKTSEEVVPSENATGFSIENADALEYFRFDVVAYGADPSGIGDSAPAFQAALEALQTQGYGTLYIPQGVFRLGKRVGVTAGSFVFAIRGEGPDRSVVQADNEEGCLQLIGTNRASQVSCRDLAFEPLRASSGTAFEFTMPSRGNRHNRSCIVDNLQVRSSATASFSAGLSLTGQWRSLIRGVGISGSPLADGTGPLKIGIDVSSSFSPRVENSSVTDAEQGILFLVDKGEGSDFVGNRLFRCREGICIRSANDGVEPQSSLVNNTFDCYDFGLRLESRKLVFVSENLFLNTLNDRADDADGVYADIRIALTNAAKQDAANTMIAGNRFEQGENPRRVMISLGYRASQVYVRNNYFDTRGTVLVNEYATANVVLENNIYTKKVDSEQADPNE